MVYSKIFLSIAIFHENYLHAVNSDKKEL